MTNFTVNNGERVDVELDFYIGRAGLTRAEGASDATLAIRATVRGASPGPGVVGGQPVDVVGTRRSPTVPSITLVDIRFLAPEGAE